MIVTGTQNLIDQIAVVSQEISAPASLYHPDDQIREDTLAVVHKTHCRVRRLYSGTDNANRFIWQRNQH